MRILEIGNVLGNLNQSEIGCYSRWMIFCGISSVFELMEKIGYSISLFLTSRYQVMVLNRTEWNQIRSVFIY